MRPCDEFLDLISAALDGELSADERAALNEHLNQCCACKALFDDLCSLHEATENIEETEAPAGFARQVMERIAAEPAQEAPSRIVSFPSKRKIYYPWKKWAVSAAVVAVVALGAYSLPGFFSMGGASAPNRESLARDQDMTGSAYNSLTDSADSAVMYDNDDSAVDQSTKDDSDPSTAPVYTLTFSVEEQPDGLEEFPFTEDEDGNLIYTVTAEYFSSLSDSVDKPLDPFAALFGDSTYLICITQP